MEDNCSIGIVEKILSEDELLVKLQKDQVCQNCAGKNSCNIFSSKDNLIHAKSEQKLDIGDEVYIYTRPSIRVLTAFIVFFLPLIMLFAGYFFGERIFASENAGIISAFTGLILTLAVIIVVYRTSNLFKQIYCWVEKKTGDLN
ncbi:MAG: SoxR reducing system RseC family protein [Spirochaetes bacterium]|nr:SoxR reducing system RseC family protein [Spirochaetota bacterium]